jgi:hypothetical protein
VFYEGVNLMERDWLLFWRFFANHDLRRSFLVAKYIGWEESPKQMVAVIQSENLLQFYKLSAKKPFYDVVLVGRSEQELEKFLRMLNANSVKMETGSFNLVSSGLEKGLILKRVTHAEVQAQTYSLANYSSFDGVWFLEENEYSLKSSFERFGALLPETLPRMGVVFEKVYERRDDPILPKIIESLDDQKVVDELKLSSMLKSQSIMMAKSSVGFSREFIRRHPEEPVVPTGLKILLGVGIGGALVWGLIRWMNKKSK